MTIEEIEALLHEVSAETRDIPIPTDLLQLAHCQLLLQIYKKLEAIEQKIEPRIMTVHHSNRVY
jgi:hypothetical protein